MLNDDRLSAGQVAQRPVADPGVLELHARRLRAAELAARALDVGAIGLRAARDLPREPDTPAVMLEALPVLSVAIVHVQRKLERLARVARQLRKLKKRQPFRVLAQDGLAAFCHLEPIAR